MQSVFEHLTETERRCYLAVIRQVTATDLRSYLASARETLDAFNRDADAHVDGGPPVDWEIHAWALAADLELLVSAITFINAGNRAAALP